jgi:hypothetical protein
MFRFSVQSLSETFLILRRTERDMFKNTYQSYCKEPVIPAGFQGNFNFLHKFSKNTQVSYFMYIRLVGSELIHAHGRTDMTKLIVAFSNFASAPQNGTLPGNTELGVRSLQIFIKCIKLWRSTSGVFLHSSVTSPFLALNSLLCPQSMAQI